MECSSVPGCVLEAEDSVMHKIVTVPDVVIGKTDQNHPHLIMLTNTFKKIVASWDKWYKGIR